jgi:hypothetical protein
VFDIKGRPVATLLDNAFRKGGRTSGGRLARRQQGQPQTRRRLYYIQIEARVCRAQGDHDSFQKVVMAR